MLLIRLLKLLLLHKLDNLSILVVYVRDQQTQAMDNKMINVFPYGMGMNPGMVVGIKKPEDGKGQPGMRIL
jgi:hypothetical protein